jgi:predicted glycoside hydrolase/deacetylase ChbG (UPF0249 family)
MKRMAERLLIINADDFGISESSNAAITELFEGEKITSAGILAPAPFAGEAAAISGRRNYSVGVHWTLTSEWPQWPWKPCGDAPTLLKDGFLAADKNILKQAKSRDVTKELEAQYLHLLDLGCRPDHADSHAGTLYGTNGRLFFLNAYTLCRKYKIPFRFAAEDSFLVRQFGEKVNPVLKLASGAIGGIGKLRGVDLLGDFCSDPRPAEKIGGLWDLKAWYEAQLSTLQGRVCEVFMHPCLPDGELLSRSSQWQKRVWEYEYLKSGDLILAARETGFKVVSWREAFM